MDAQSQTQMLTMAHSPNTLQQQLENLSPVTVGGCQDTMPPTKSADSGSIAWESVSYMTSTATSVVHTPETSEHELEPESMYKRNSSFFFDEEPVKLLVGGELFQVHGYLFARESDEARHLISRENMNPAGIVSISDDIQAIEFQRFLSMLYLRYGESASFSGEDEWESVLLVSTRYNFPAIRKTAMEKLYHHPNISSIDRVLLARQYDIDEWLVPALVEICTSDELPSDEDSERLGFATFRQIVRAQRRMRSPLGRLVVSTREEEAIVKEVFGLEGKETASPISAPHVTSPSSTPSETSHLKASAAPLPPASSHIFASVEAAPAPPLDNEPRGSRAHKSSSEAPTAPVSEYKPADKRKARLVATVELNPLDTTLPSSAQYDALHEKRGQNVVASTQTESTLKPQPAASTAGSVEPVQASESEYDVFGKVPSPVLKKRLSRRKQAADVSAVEETVSKSPVEQRGAIARFSATVDGDGLHVFA